MSQLGILVGRRTFKKGHAGEPGQGRTKDYILQLVRTPDENEGVSSLRVVSRGKEQFHLDVDVEWVCEHACQLARILPGGLSILGLYVLCDARAFSPKSFEGLLKLMNSQIIAAGSSHASIVIHIDSVRGVLSAKEQDGSLFKPCEVQNSSLLTEMVEFRCTYPLELSLDMCNDKGIVSELIDDLITFEVKNRIQPMCILPKGDNLISSEQMVARYIKRDGLDHVPVSLMTPCTVQGPPALGVSSSSGAHGEKMSGTYVKRAHFSFKGAMECRGYILKSEDIQDAVDALKQDVEISLRARLEILVEAAEMATEALQARQKNAPSSSSSGKEKKAKHPLLDSLSSIGSYEPQFPQRAFLRWKQSVCCYCDYIVEGDGVTEALGRIRELVGHGIVDGTTYHCSEKIANESNVRKTTQRKGLALCALFSSCNIMVALPIIIAIIAMLYVL